MSWASRRWGRSAAARAGRGRLHASGALNNGTPGHRHPCILYLSAGAMLDTMTRIMVGFCEMFAWSTV
jgi:hypothetical protein